MTYNVSKIIVHGKFLDLLSNFDDMDQESFSWDFNIALIQLNVSLSKEVEVIDLPPSSYNVSEVDTVKCKAAGKF